jgi:multiple sugar transport system ATP-binding protein
MQVDIEVVEPTGGEVLVFTTIDGTEVVAKSDPNRTVRRGDRVMLTADMKHMHLIDPQTNLVVGSDS